MDTGTLSRSKKPSWLQQKSRLTRAIAFSFGRLLLAVFARVFDLLRNSEVSRKAVAHAEQNQLVTERLGRPLQAGLLVAGSLQVANDSGAANLTIPVRGTMGSGTIHAVAERSSGVWQFRTLTIQFPGQPEVIDLLAAPAASSRVIDQPSPFPAA